MKNRIILILGLFSILLVGCNSENQLSYTEDNNNVRELLHKVGSELYEYELNLKEFVNEDVEVSTSIEYYEDGEHIDSINFMDTGVDPEFYKMDISMSITGIDDNTNNFTTTMADGVSFSEITLPDNRGTSGTIFYMGNLKNLEKNKNYYLAYFGGGEDARFSEIIPDDEERFLEILELLDYTYVYTLKIEDK